MSELRNWDYIIVGAGSAGCVLAERLSANSRISVLLIEEGSHREDWLVRMPKGFAKTLANPRRASYAVTAHDRGAAEASPDTWMRGKMLGGSSTVNGMVWMRGHPSDYDRYRELGLSGWSWSELLPYFRRLENHELGASDLHGGDGPFAIATKRPRTRLGDAFIKAGENLGLPHKRDQNSLDQEGLGYLQMNIDSRGRRISTARAFMDRARSRRNLTIVSGTRIDRVLFEQGRAVGAEGLCDGQTISYRAAGEVILSAGGICSPAIMQRSGIGAAPELMALGIDVIHHSPGVGRNVREHWLLQIQFQLRHAADTLNRSFSGARLAGNLLRYALAGKGPLASGPFEAGGFVRTRPELDRPDAQLMFAPISQDERGGPGFESEPGMQIFGYKLRPESTGTIDITSTDPTAPLRIEPRYLSTESDRRDSIAMIRLIRRLAGTPPLGDFVKKETARSAGAQTDEEILRLFTRYGQAGYHACGACSMGLGPLSVLDERLRVRGVANLRVVDLSIVPEMLSGNTNAPVMAMAWRAADLIIEDRRKVGGVS
jgi:choline dehydrogenase-like flavoprotein